MVGFYFVIGNNFEKIIWNMVLKKKIYLFFREFIPNIRPIFFLILDQK